MARGLRERAVAYHKIVSALVPRNGKLVGIFTPRDACRVLARMTCERSGEDLDPQSA